MLICFNSIAFEIKLIMKEKRKVRIICEVAETTRKLGWKRLKPCNRERVRESDPVYYQNMSCISGQCRSKAWRKHWPSEDRSCRGLCHVVYYGASKSAVRREWIGFLSFISSEIGETRYATLKISCPRHGDGQLLNSAKMEQRSQGAQIQSTFSSCVK